MIFQTFFTSLMSTSNIVVETLRTVGLFIEGVLFQLVSYSYKLFSLMCQLNFNSIYAIVAPLMDRLKAVIMVLVVFKLGLALIQIMMDPDKLLPKGKDLLKNIVLTAVLLLTYNLVFTLLNEFSMLILGTPSGYSFTALKEIAGVTDGEDEGLIMRFVFGEESDVSEIGDFIAFKSVEIFVRNTTTDDTLEETLQDGESYNFMKLPNLANKVDKTVEYTPFVGILLGLFLLYTFLNITGEIGIRMFKLLILQMMAPLAIITVIDKGWNSDIFSKYRKTYLSIYSSVFVRILSILIVTVFVAKFLTNIGDFFGATLSLETDALTQCLISLIVIFAGYKFVLDIPSLLKDVFGVDISGVKGKDGFASTLGGMLAGGIMGAAGGLASGATLGQKIAGAAAGAATGLGRGAYSSARGNKISDTIKGINEQTTGWKTNGGVFNAGYAALNDIVGNTGRQDRKMGRYNRAQAALDAYENAKVAAMKDQKVSDTELKGADLANAYSTGYADVKYSDSKDGFVSKMLDYDVAYQDAQSKLDEAMQKGNNDDIRTARENLLAVRKQATERAEKLYDHKKESVSNDKIERRRKEANIAHKATQTFKERAEEAKIYTKDENGVVHDEKIIKKTDNKKLDIKTTTENIRKVIFDNNTHMHNNNSSIDVKEAKKGIEQKQSDLQGKKSYEVTHTDSKK